MDILRDMLSSKKFIAMLVGIVVTLTAKVGFDIDDETATMIVGLVASYVLGQGIADNGKSKALIDAVSKDLE